MPADKLKPTAAEIHRAVEFAKTCPPGINRTAAWAHELAEYRAVLARDPQFILAAVDDLLDEAMLHTRSKLRMDVSGEPCGSVRDAYAKLKAARNA